ncbi:MAG: hypothetical protein AMXMBFR47_36460 [Planctomycetota bacterium]
MAFSSSGVTFCWDGATDYIDSDAFFSITTWAELDAVRAVNSVPDTVNIYFVDSLQTEGGTWCGYSSFTWSPVQGIVMANDCTGTPADPSTFPHELGHYFDLLHTHETAMGAECVDGSNCSTAGDLLCDTPADPLLGANNVNAICEYTGSETDPCANAFYQPDSRNLMSYSRHTCRQIFSPQQNLRMQATLTNLRPELAQASCSPPCFGDVNGDRVVDLSDLTVLLAHFGTPSGASRADGDLDGDGDVDLSDLSLLLGHFGESCAITPPVGMVTIPAGEFLMGNSFAAGEGDADELPRHAVYVDAFYMDVFEVTNAQYAAVLNWARAQGNQITVTNGVVYKYNSGTSYPYCDTTTSSSYSRITWNGSTFGVVAGKEQHPMVRVSWYGAAAYANWRSAMAGKPLCYNLSTWACNFDVAGFRLPTEAEWEKAARGGAAGRRFPWGDQDTIQHARCNYYSSTSYSYDTSPTRGYHPLWVNGSNYPFTSPVGFFNGSLRYRADWGWPGSATSYQTANGANGYGLHDTAGNVWEWCNDWYGSTYYSSSPYSNPTGPISGTYRVLRGGSWYGTALGRRVANRLNYTPANRSYINGFRCASGTP